MNKDVRIATNYPNHPKIRKLKKLLGPEGVMSHVFLLCYTAQTCPSGILKDMDAEDIAQVAQWRGYPEKFVNALVECKLLDNNSEFYCIHNWLRHNLFAATAPKRSQIARANIKKRWDKKTKIIQEDNTNRNTDSKTPSPSPTPTPSPSGEGRERGGVDSDIALEGQSSSTPLIEELIQLASEMYRGSYIDATKEHRFFRIYKRLGDDEKADLQKALKLNGLHIALDEISYILQ
jgi:hypothetical protein